jgi:hypothetical protein
VFAIATLEMISTHTYTLAAQQASGQDVPKDSEEMIKRSRSKNEKKKA